MPNDLAPVIEGAIRETTGKPLKWLINTHWHPDHIACNPAWAAKGVTIIDQSTNIYEVNNQIVINNFADERDRLAYDSSGVDYYSYADGSWSETVYRDDGSQVITIYDRWGNIISRSVFVGMREAVREMKRLIDAATLLRELPTAKPAAVPLDTTLHYQRRTK